MSGRRAKRPSLFVIFAAAAVLGISAFAALGEAKPAKTTFAAVGLAPEDGSGVKGFAFFKQAGTRLSGTVVVWGLRPRSPHAVHFHGPSARCGGTPADPVAAHADLRADDKGVAYASFRTVSRSQVLRGGFYYNVHEKPAVDGKSLSLTCGDVRPAR